MTRTNKKYFFDLGAYNGDLLYRVLQCKNKFDYYIAFEPVPCLYEIIKERFKKHKNIFVNNYAIDTVDNTNVPFYVSLNEKDSIESDWKEIGDGSTLLHNKITYNLVYSSRIEVSTINFSRFLKNTVNKKDTVVIKMDIEGKEYDVLEHMIETNTIKYVDAIFCDWHFHKIGSTNKKSKVYARNKKRHNKLISRLNKFGFNLRGDKKIKSDELKFDTKDKIREFFKKKR